MLQSIKLFATYNASTNEKVHDLLRGLEPSLYSQERNTYFKSIQGLHLHIISTSKLLQSLIRTNSDGKYFVSPYTEEAFEVKPLTLDESSKLLSEPPRICRSTFYLSPAPKARPFYLVVRPFKMKYPRQPYCYRGNSMSDLRQTQG
jgi:hypothetical protein